MRPGLTATKSRWSPVALALLVALLGVVAWLVLRQPAWRAWLVALAPQRPAIHQAAVRQILAPRSVLLAGLGIATMAGLCLASRRCRRQAMRPIPGSAAAVALLALLQVLVAVAVVVNLHAYFARQYGRPVGRIPEDAVLTYTVPQAWPDSRELLRRLPQDAQVGVKVDGPDLFLLPAMAYPIGFFEAYPAEPARPLADPEFATIARSRGLTHVLEYRPMDRANPFNLRSLSVARRVE